MKPQRVDHQAGLKTRLYERGDYFLMLPVTPSGEQLNGSIFNADGAYSIVALGNGTLKNSGSIISLSTTRRWRAASKLRRSTVVRAAECSRPLVGLPGCSTYWLITPAA